MKKVLSLMLVLVMVLGMSTMAFAATVKVDKDSGTRAVLTAPNGGDLDDREVQDGQTEFDATMTFSGVKLKDSTGTWSKVASGGTVYTMTEKERKDSKITLKSIIKKGSAAIDEVKFATVSGEQVIRLVLVEDLKSNNTDGIEFEVETYLVVDGRHWNTKDTSEVITWTGTYMNRKEVIDADYDYVWMGSGVIIEADEYIKSIECDLDEGVSVFAKMFKDKKYWAVATTDTDGDDEEIMMDTLGIDTVYHIKQTGLAAVAEYVLLNDEDSSMYVYTIDDSQKDLFGAGDGLTLKYLGKGDSKLPMAEVYYLSSKQLDLEEIDEPIEEIDDPSDIPEIPEELGGDDDYPANVNDNPGTGR